MKPLPLAIAITLGSAVFLCAALYPFLESHMAFEIAGLPFIALHHLYETLERSRAKRNLSVAPECVSSYEGFGISWQAMIVFGALALFGIMQGSSAVGGLLAALFVPPELFSRVLLLISLPLNLIGGYLLGFWMGSRSVKHGVIATIIAVLLGRALSSALDFMFVRGPDFENIFHMPKTVGTLTAQLLLGSVILGIPCLLGYWRGSRVRLSKYLQYLLKILPSETRGTIVNLAYEEAQRIAPAKA